MKTKMLIVIILLSLSSCKEEAKNNALNKEVTNEVNRLMVEVTLKSSMPGKFKLFANNIFLSNDQEMNISITHNLKTKPDFEKIVFKFPENINPEYQLGLNLGTKYEKEVQFLSMKLNYGATEFNIPPEKMNDFLVFNKFISVDSITSKIKTSKIDNKHNPIVFFRRKILDSIQNIY